MKIEKIVQVRFVTMNREFPCRVMIDSDAGTIQIVKVQGWFKGHTWEMDLSPALEMIMVLGTAELNSPSEGGVPEGNEEIRKG
jgi:hypothetical protein